jgi:hypothetical protein
MTNDPYRRWGTFGYEARLALKAAEATRMREGGEKRES